MYQERIPQTGGGETRQDPGRAGREKRPGQDDDSALLGGQEIRETEDEGQPGLLEADGGKARQAWENPVPGGILPWRKLCNDAHSPEIDQEIELLLMFFI